MHQVAFKLAASSVIVAMSMTGLPANIAYSRPAPASSSASDQQAMRLNEQARQSIQQGNLPAALGAMEQAVELSPRDVGYRLLLAEIYLKSGRFESARATFGDVLELDPSNVRGGLSYALVQIALGRPQAAVAQLDDLAGRAPPADVGLAYALAGLPERAIELLEPAARSIQASPRVRQNLALSYAIAGDWQRARTIAAQDVSPGELGRRLEQWATFVQPRSSWDQVASLLGVSPGQDSGQPVRLALRAPEPEPVAYAQAEPEMPPVELPPLRFASIASPAGLPVVAPAAPAAAPAPAEPEQPAVDPVNYAAVQALVTPEPTVIRASATVAAPPPPVFERPRPHRTETPRTSGAGRYAVQLGAFSNEANAERAWVQAERRFGLAQRQPLTTTIDLNGRTLHRVSVAGFSSQADANRLCSSIQARGGSCFVRTIAGDAPVRWAARYGPGQA